jgi:hypothetical protein
MDLSKSLVIAERSVISNAGNRSNRQSYSAGAPRSTVKSHGQRGQAKKHVCKSIARMD